MKGRWQTVELFSGETGVAPTTVRRWCRQGDLVCKKIGQTWLVWSEVPELPEEERGYQRQLREGE